MWHDATVSYPKWLSEGFAEVNATAVVTDDGGVQIGRASQYRAANGDVGFGDGRAIVRSAKDARRAAHQLLVDGKLPEARRALIPLAFDPHSRGESNFAAPLVEMIDKGEPAAKIAAEKPKTAAGEKAAEDDGAKKKGD